MLACPSDMMPSRGAGGVFGKASHQEVVLTLGKPSPSFLLTSVSLPVGSGSTSRSFLPAWMTLLHILWALYLPHSLHPRSTLEIP